MIIKGNSFATTYQELLDTVYNRYEYISNPRGLEIKEISNVEIEITNPYNNLFNTECRPFPTKYLAGELLWYFTKRNDLDFIKKYSKFWEKISNTNETLNSAYGYLIFNQYNEYQITEWQWALNQLIKDKDTRQAILRFNKPTHSFDNNKDFVCTLNGVFNIRNNKLHFTIMMRSQDLHKGITYDIPFFTLLQQQMRNHLLPYYPNLEIGSYKHYVISAHIYSTDYELTEKILLEEVKELSLPILKEDLISSNLHPNENLINIINKKDITTDDELIKWIRNNS